MRFASLLVAACGYSQIPPKQTVFPTLEPGETYNTRIAALRTTLGRAGIALRVAGFDSTFGTADCDSQAPAERFGGCARCELAGERTPVNGAVLEAATRAFARYPTAVLAAVNIDHVAVCRKLVHGKRDAAPASVFGPVELEHPAGLADVRGRGLLISLEYFLDRMYRAHGEFTVDDIAHHEVFHLLEWEHMRALMTYDPEWPTGGGYVNAYAKTSPIEDKASVFEYVMAHPNELCELARTDELVKTKVTLIWRRVAKAVGTDAFMRTAAPCVDWI